MNPAAKVFVPGGGVIGREEPFIRADDLGVLRGDGLFETMHVRAGRPWLVAEHLARLARSAAAIALELPPAAALTELLEAACDGWPAETEAALRLLCTRGPEHGGPPTIYATITAVAPRALRQRAEGIRVGTLSLGVAATARTDLDWLPAGMKTLSYGASTAAARWAAAHDLDDILWISTDGYALEGPTSSLVWCDGDTLCTVPAARTGILPSVTTNWLLAHAGELGLRGAERMVTPAELSGAAGVWLLSSVRGPAEVTALDGAALSRSPHTPGLRRLLGFPV